MRALKLLVVLAGVLAVASPAGAWEPGPESYGVHEVHDENVRMSDGVEMAADVHYPADPATGRAGRRQLPRGPLGHPVRQELEARRPSAHGSEYGGNGYWPWLVKRGYINALVEVRGTGSSGGDFELFGRASSRTAWSW